MADVLRRDRSPVMAAAVLLDHHRAKVRAVVLLDHHPVKVREAVLLGRHRVKVQVGVLPDHRPVMALAAALQGSPAAVGALRDHRRVMAAEGTMVVATAVGGKAATAVEATSSSTVNRYLLTAGVVAVIVSLQPVLVAALAPRLVGERVGALQWLGGGFGVSGRGSMPGCCFRC
jgi:hypothetical protein